MLNLFNLFRRQTPSKAKQLKQNLHKIFRQLGQQTDLGYDFKNEQGYNLSLFVLSLPNNFCQEPELLRELGYADPYDFIDKTMNKAKLAHISRTRFENNPSSYPVLCLDYPSPRGLLTSTFIISNGDNLGLLIKDNYFTFGGESFCKLIDEAQYLDIFSQHPNDFPHLQALFNAVEDAADYLQIRTWQNQGKFRPPFDAEQSIRDFIARVAESHTHQVDAEIMRNQWHLIEQDPHQYVQYLIDQGELELSSKQDYANPDYLFHSEQQERDYYAERRDELLRYWLSEHLHHYATDWKIDNEDFSQFISEIIEKPYSLDFDQKGNQPPAFAQELAQVDKRYCLMNIQTGGDDYRLALFREPQQCQKIAYLARHLDIPLQWIEPESTQSEDNIIAPNASK